MTTVNTAVTWRGTGDLGSRRILPRVVLRGQREGVMVERVLVVGGRGWEGNRKRKIGD